MERPHLRQAEPAASKAQRKRLPGARRRTTAQESSLLSRDMARLSARIAHLEAVLGLAEEPVRIIRIG